MTDVQRYPVVVVECSPDETEVFVGKLTVLGADGIEERDATTLVKGGARGATLVASFADEQTAREAVEVLGENARFDVVVGDAWRDGWKAHWAPTPIGSRLVVVPTWHEYEAAPGEVVLRLDPGRAFGTGQHASTALAAHALERVVTDARPSRVIDVGCGSGILSFAALLLGVEHAVACDLDPEAVDAARENALALGLADRIELRTGTVGVVSETATLVVANIEATVLVPIAAEIAGRVAPGGTLVLSGILAEQRDIVVGAYVATGLAFARCDERSGWIAPEFTRPR